MKIAAVWPADALAANRRTSNICLPRVLDVNIVEPADEFYYRQ